MNSIGGGPHPPGVYPARKWVLQIPILGSGISLPAHLFADYFADPRTILAGEPKMTRPCPFPIEESASRPNPSVQRCCATRDRSLEDSRAGNVEKYEAKRRSEDAYRNALPDLDGYQNIRDFVACI